MFGGRKENHIELVNGEVRDPTHEAVETVLIAIDHNISINNLDYTLVLLPDQYQGYMWVSISTDRFHIFMVMAYIATLMRVSCCLKRRVLI